MYTFPVAFIVLKQQFPTRPDIDAIPDIIVIFAIFFFSFLFMVIILFCSPRYSAVRLVLFPRYSAVFFLLFPGLYVGLSCSVFAVFRGFLSSVPRH